MMKEEVCIGVGSGNDLCWPIELFIASLALECVFYLFIIVFGVSVKRWWQQRKRGKEMVKEMNRFPPYTKQRRK